MYSISSSYLSKYISPLPHLYRTFLNISHPFLIYTGPFFPYLSSTLLNLFHPFLIYPASFQIYPAPFLIYPPPLPHVCITPFIQQPFFIYQPTLPHLATLSCLCIHFPFAFHLAHIFSDHHWRFIHDPSTFICYLFTIFPPPSLINFPFSATLIHTYSYIFPQFLYIYPLSLPSIFTHHFSYTYPRPNDSIHIVHHFYHFPLLLGI